MKIRYSIAISLSIMAFLGALVIALVFFAVAGMSKTTTWSKCRVLAHVATNDYHGNTYYSIVTDQGQTSVGSVDYYLIKDEHVYNMTIRTEVPDLLSCQEVTH